jgi:hypothetical protein
MLTTRLINLEMESTTFICLEERAMSMRKAFSKASKLTVEDIFVEFFIVSNQVPAKFSVTITLLTDCKKDQKERFLP